MKRFLNIVRITNIIFGIIILGFFIYLVIISFNKVSKEFKQKPYQTTENLKYLEDFKKALESYFK